MNLSPVSASRPRELDVQFARDEGEGYESDRRTGASRTRVLRAACPVDTPIVAMRSDCRGVLRVWVDMTASAHVLVFRPLIASCGSAATRWRSRRASTRRRCNCSSCTGCDADAVIGHHGGRSRTGKARAMASRLRALAKLGARPRAFDIALAHGSHELTMTARRLGIPSSTTFDYEWAWLQHQLGCRAATKVVVPDAIPPERLARYGATPPKLVQYEGLKEEYYLADFEPDDAVLEQFGLDRARVLVVLRPPPDVSLYHRHSNPLFPQTLDFVGARDDVHAIVLPRTEEQRDFVRGLDLPSVIVPEEAVDAQSLIALRRPRRLCGRDDEPRGCRARRPRLHDLRRPARRRRRGADPRRAPRAAQRPARAAPREAQKRRRDARVRRDPHRMLDLLLSAIHTSS